MSAIIPQGIPRPHHAEPSQIPGTDTGIASDACVATHARSTDVGRLARETRTPWSARPPDR